MEQPAANCSFKDAADSCGASQSVDAVIPKPINAFVSVVNIFLNDMNNLLTPYEVYCSYIDQDGTLSSRPVNHWVGGSNPQEPFPFEKKVFFLRIMDIKKARRLLLAFYCHHVKPAPLRPCLQALFFNTLC